MKIPYLRWVIAGLLLFASLLNYIDRQALSILAPTVQKDLQINDDQYAMIASFFLAAYTVAYLLSGRVVDWLGARVSMALFVGWWSVANAITGLAQGVWSMIACRFLLGLGEAGGYTASPKVVAEWFPAKERGIAVGIFSMGGALGATLAPFIIIKIAVEYGLGWRGAFLVTGGIGLIFVTLWLLFYRPMEEHPALSDAERAHIKAGQQPEQAVGETVAAAPAPASKLSEKELWISILTNRTAWALMAGRLLTDPVWYFYLFWMSKYLHDARGLTQEQLTCTWVIFLAADCGFLFSGFIAARLVKNGMRPTTSRLMLMMCAAILMPLLCAIPYMPNADSVLYLGMIVALCHAAWLSNITAYIVDLVPSHILGTAFGFIAAGSALGGIFMNQSVAWAIHNYSYTPCFIVMGVLHPIAFLILWKLGRTWKQ